MYALLDFSFYSTIKNLEPDTLDRFREFYGDDAVRKIRESGLYEEMGEYLYLTACNLSANIFEGMPGVVTEEELSDYLAWYMKENGMWPTERPVAELVRYSVDVALPLFVNAGLLEIV